MGREIKKLMEQMPKAEQGLIDRCQLGGTVSVYESGIVYGAQAQQEADAKWIQEQELVRLPSEGQMREILGQFSWLARSLLDKLQGEE